MGIGIYPTPQEKLDVNGNINTSGAYKIGGATILTNKGHSSNIFVGENAGTNNPATNTYNTGVGNYVLWNNTTGTENTAMGGSALSLNTSGRGNTAVGQSVLAFNTSGILNSAVGASALHKNREGRYNLAVGADALYNKTTGNNNTAIGYGAGHGNITGSGNVFLGYMAGYQEADSNTLYIENSDSNFPLIYGEFDYDIVAINGTLGVGTTSPTAKLEVVGNIKTSGLYENISGNIGIGTTSPGARLDVSNAEDTDLIMFSTSGTNRFSITAHGSGSDYLSIRSKFENPDTDIVVFRGDGRVGVGTTTPQQKMHISGVMRLEPQSSPPSGGLGDLYVGTDGKLYFHNGTQWKEVSLL